MDNSQASGEGNHHTDDSPERSLADNTVDLNLPARPEYLPVLRAAVGVLAGSMAFNYDEILHLRVAVSEAFGLALKHAEPGVGAPEVSRMAVSIVLWPAELEIRVSDPKVDAGPVDEAEETESRAVLEGLMDRVEFGVEVDGGSVIRLVKYISAEAS